MKLSRTIRYGEAQLREIWFGGGRKGISAKGEFSPFSGAWAERTSNM